MPSRSPLLLAACAAVALALGLPALAGATAGSADDFFVVLVYARNLLEGNGFVHQLGGPTVDGFTSPLDLALKTLALALHPADGVRAAWWATALAYLGALVVCAWTAWRLVAGGPGALGTAAAPGAAPRWLAWLSALLGSAALALAPGLAEGSAYLLEAPLVAALWLVLLAQVAFPRPGAWRLAAACGAALLTARPEGLALAPLALACLPSGSRGRALACWIPFAAVWIAAHYAVFGHLAPNAYYAKASGERMEELTAGARYVLAFLGTTQGLAVVLAWGAGLAAAARGLAPRAPALLAGAALAIVVWSGGDGYLGTRLLLPFSLAAIASAAAALSCPAASARVPAAGALVALVASLLPGLPLSLWSADIDASDLARRSADYVGERRMAERLATVEPTVHLGHLHLQAAAWFAPELRVLDLSGLNDPTIAHLPLDGPVGFGREALVHGIERGVDVLHLSPSRLDGFVLASRPLLDAIGNEDLRRVLFGELRFTPERVERLQGWLPATLLDVGGPGLHANVIVQPGIASAMTRAGWTVGRWSGE